MPRVIEGFSKADLEEVFPNAPIREVAFEIRFAPRLRVNAELWRLQDQLVEQYPNVGTESAIFASAGVPLVVNVFQNQVSGRVIKVSQQNFVIAFTKYSRFEDFTQEVLEKTKQFCSTFGVTTLERVGLRYVNNIVIPVSEPTSLLLRLVRPFTDFDRVPIESVEEFVNEIKMRHKNHMVTLRGVLLPPLEHRRRVYVLDIDCHSAGPETAERIATVLDSYHESAQIFFLDHITEEYKNVMRGKSWESSR